ncbi:MAG: YkvA family protein [Tepidanaerobacteraceae bacterium]|jgi:uncharacterized membrane protein YkvA (DUF1232 family)|nr:YkvA family protein [Tepidanaerobacteraceae bacterium]
MSSSNYFGLFKGLWMAFKFMLDPSVPIGEKIWIIISILYFISPIDVIPDPIFGIGILDDFVVFLLMLSFMSGKLKKYAETKNKSNFARRQRNDPDTIDVEYEVIDSEKNK